jgi:acyl phosphate:glycerol-3-phosphate acyltransferase
MLNVFRNLLFLAGGYILGSIPVGYIFCKISRNIDIRKYGSGNIGATNVYRIVGMGSAILVLALDILKGFIPVYLVKYVVDTPSVMVIATGIMTVLGHNFSVFLKGKGGKGVATSFGVIVGIFPVAAFFSFLVWLTVVFLTHYISAGSIMAALFLPVFIFFLQKNTVYTITGIVIFLLIIFTHRANIKRLIKKQEHKINLPWKKR